MKIIENYQDETFNPQENKDKIIKQLKKKGYQNRLLLSNKEIKWRTSQIFEKYIGSDT